jgi:hypothetical protein
MIVENNAKPLILCPLIMNIPKYIRYLTGFFMGVLIGPTLEGTFFNTYK